MKQVPNTFKRFPHKTLRRRIAWQTGADIETRTQNAKLVYWQIYKRVDPHYTAGMIFALLLQGMSNNTVLSWQITQRLANYGLYTLGGLSTLAASNSKGIANSAAAEKLRNLYAGESLDAYAVHLRGHDLEKDHSYAYARALRFGLAADKFSREVEWPNEQKDRLIRWVTLYGAYTSLNWHPTKSKDPASVIRQDRLLLQLHTEIRELLPLTFNHVIMAVAYMAKKK